MKKDQMQKRISAREELYKRLDAGELDLADAVKLIRNIYGLTQEDYAKKVGVSKMTVTDIERRKGNPTLKSVNKVLGAMKLELQISRIK